MPYFQPGPRLHLLVDILAFIPTHALVLPLTALYHATRYWLVRRARRFPRLGWWRYVVLNVLRVRTQCIRGLCVNYPDPDAERLIPSKYDGECDVEVVRVPPIREEVPRIEVLSSKVVKQGTVKGNEVPGFWIRKKGEEGEKVRRGAEGERNTDGLMSERPHRQCRTRGARHLLHRRRRICPWPPSQSPHGILIRQAHRSACFLHQLPQVPRRRVSIPGVPDRHARRVAVPHGHRLRPTGTTQQLVVKADGQNVMLTGDSAGANACLGLTRYLDALRQHGFDWGLPNGLALHCVSLLRTIVADSSRGET